MPGSGFRFEINDSLNEFVRLSMNRPQRSPLFDIALDTIGQQLRQRSADPAQPHASDTRKDAQRQTRLEDYAQILQGRLPLHPTPVALPELLEQCWQTLTPEAAAKGLRYTRHGLALLPQQVLADARRLRQIVHHLLSNAIRYTASGRVELHAHWHGEQAPRGVLYLYVVDTGAGMSSRMKDKLFNPFDQVLTHLHRHHRGQTGFSGHLGLVVTAGIVRAWGGQIELRSALGTGSTFMVELPMAPA